MKKTTSLSYKIVIPNNVESQIRYLCRRVWDNEWSGILFYTVEGTFETSLVVTCKDILPMDIGTGAATEFEMSPDVISYMAENQELLDCKMGLIHSHNNMKTFFSGTDLHTLNVEGNERNHFVSLIVNNEGTYTAGITRKIEFTQLRKAHYTSFDGVVDMPVEDETKGVEIEWYNLEVQIEQNPNIRVLSSRLDQIEEEKEAVRKEKAKTSFTGTSFTGYKFDEEWPISYGSEYSRYPYESSAKSLYSDDEPTLFSNLEKEEASDYPKEETKEDNTSDQDVPVLEVSKESLNAIVLKLLTGCIAINKSKLSAKALANNMTKLFDKQFGRDQLGLKKFRDWADGHLNYIMWFGIPESNEIVDDSQVAGLATLIIDELKELPQNEYIKEYIDLLEIYSTYK